MADKILVCATYDAAIVVDGSIFDRNCSKCGIQVMIAPSGQRALRDMPGLAIICSTCFSVRDDTATVRNVLLSHRTLEELQAEMASATANPRSSEPSPGFDLPLYVIYSDPLDAPGKFVLRRHVGERPDPAPAAVVDSLEACRAALPPGLFNLGRYDEDDPKIVEVWI